MLFNCLLVHSWLEHHLGQDLHLLLLLSLDLLIDDDAEHADADRGADGDPEHVVQSNVQMLRTMVRARTEEWH